MTEISIKVNHIVATSIENLTLDKLTLPSKHVLYIYYLLCFRKNQVKLQTLFNFGSENNAIIPVYAKKLGLYTYKTYVGAQKIAVSSLATYGMVISGVSNLRSA